MLRHKRQTMRIKYFEATDTTIMELSNNPTLATQELNENLYIDLDGQGIVVSITIEHADRSANMQELLYQRIPAGLAASTPSAFGTSPKSTADVQM